MKKRIYAFAMFLIIFVTSYSGPIIYGYSQLEANKVYNSLNIESLNSKSFALLDFDSGTIVYEKEGDKRYFVGNMVKLMTLYLTYEYMDKGKGDLESDFLVPQHAQDKSVGYSRVFLDAGKKERIRIGQAIEAICIANAHDAAYALGNFIGGSEVAFVELMNKKALDLGLKNTKFTDSAGIDKESYMSAADAAILSYHLVKNYPKVLEYTQLTYGDFEHWSTGEEDSMMVSSNHIIKYYSGADGLLTGYSNEDGYAGVGTISKNGRRAISVVIGLEDPNYRVAELKKLLEYGLSSFEYRVIDGIGTFVRQLPIIDGVKKRISTSISSDFAVILKKELFSEIKREVIVYPGLKAPVKKGDVVGYVTYTLDEEEIGRVDIIAAEDMARIGWFKRLIRRILAWLGLD